MNALGISLLILLAAVSCRKNEYGSSELKWGHLSYTQMSGTNWLGHVGPNDQVEVCGDEVGEAKKAILMWAQHIGRGPYLKIADCGQASNARVKITLQTNVSEYPCSINGVQGATTPNDGVVRICANLAAPKYNVILHEIGHMWGLCDQYGGGQNCDKQHSGQVDDSSVMGQGAKNHSEPTPDDITGIKEMAKRSEFAQTTKAWDDYLATNPTPTNTDQPGTPTPTPTTPGASGQDIFIGLPDINGTSSSTYVWMATHSGVTSTKLCIGDRTFCATTPNMEGLFFEQQNMDNSSRVYFKATTKYPLKTLVGKTITAVGYDASNKIIEMNSVVLEEK